MALFVRRALAAAGLVVCLPAAAPAQESVTITGRVTSDAGPPLPLAEVSIPALGLGALTKEDGRYTILVPGARVTAQPVTVTARRLAFKAQSVQISLAGGSASVTQDFVLAATPLQLVPSGQDTTTPQDEAVLRLHIADQRRVLCQTATLIL